VAIRAVTFDFWGTLYRDTIEATARRRDRRVRQIESFLAAKGTTRTAQQVRGALVAVEQRAANDIQTGQGSADKMRIGDMLAEALGCSVDEEGIETLGAVVAGAVVYHPPVLIDGAQEMLETLEGKYRMAVICNTRLSVGEALRQVMANDLVLDYFETQTFSDETPVSKPAARPFLHTIELMGVPPTEAVHVGDSEPLDVHGARKAGMHAVLIRNGSAAAPSRANAVIASLADLPAALEVIA